MLLRLFSDSKFGTAILIFLFAALLWMPGFLNPEALIFNAGVRPMPLYSFFGRFVEDSVLASKIIAFIFMLFQAVLVVRLNVNFMLIEKRTFLPSFFFILLISFYFPHLQFSGYMFGSFGMLLILNLIFSSYKQPSDSWRFFESGLIIGIASLFYARMIYFVPFIWIAQIILRPPSWREWLYPVLGVIIPAIIIVSVRYLRDLDPWGIWNIFYDNLNNFSPGFEFSRQYLIIALLVFLLVIIASAYMLRIFQFRKIYIRNYYLVFFWLFVISAILFIFLTRFDPGILFMAAIPVSFILSNYFINAPKNLMNRVLFGMILFVFLANGLNHWFDWL